MLGVETGGGGSCADLVLEVLKTRFKCALLCRATSSAKHRLDVDAKFSAFGIAARGNSCLCVLPHP